MTGPTDPEGTRFSDEAFSLVLKRAAELQAQQQHHTDGAGYSLAEMQEIAAEAGISPAHVAAAAAEVSSDRAYARPTPRGTLARASRFHFESRVDGELTDDDLAELVDVLRAHTTLAGEVEHGRRGMVWNATDGLGSTRVDIRRRGGGTRITIEEARDATLFGSYIVASVVAFFVGALLVIALREAGVPKAIALASWFAFIPLVGWLGGGVLWRSRAAAWRERVRVFGDELTSAARDVIARSASQQRQPTLAEPPTRGNDRAPNDPRLAP